jgi:hypothetical protein
MSRRTYRPQLGELVLEDRVVLSQASSQIMVLPTRFGNDGSVLGQIRNQYIRQFRVSYSTLATNLESAASAALASGDTATLQTQVGLDLQALDQDLTAMLSLSPLAQKSLTPTIQESIVGDGADSLKTLLNGLSSSITGGSSLTDIENQAIAILNASLKQNVKRLVFFASDANPDRQQIAGAHRNAPALALIHSSYETQYKAAFTTFGQAYASAAQTMLNVTDASQLPANRVIFDAAVDGLLGTLNSTLSSMNSISPAAKFSLTPEVTSRLIGGDANSLESQLRSLPTPIDTSTASVQTFQAEATALINQAQTDILADLNTFFNRRHH